ncbi:MAG: hypothetical protein ABH896_01105 [Candidatus Jacksonbacteria bacterium]
MTLYINTTLENKLEVALYDQKGQKSFFLSKEVNRDESEKLLKTIDEAVRSNGGKDVVKGIIVIKGPRGRFSAIRTGVVCANALGFAWDIPVLGIRQGENVKIALQRISKFKNFTKPAMPVYEKEPNLGR